jgi:hypothetical protein
VRGFYCSDDLKDDCIAEIEGIAALFPPLPAASEVVIFREPRVAIRQPSCAKIIRLALLMDCDDCGGGGTRKCPLVARGQRGSIDMSRFVSIPNQDMTVKVYSSGGGSNRLFDNPAL